MPVDGLNLGSMMLENHVNAVQKKQHKRPVSEKPRRVSRGFVVCVQRVYRPLKSCLPIVLRIHARFGKSSLSKTWGRTSSSNAPIFVLAWARFHRAFSVPFLGRVTN